MRRHYTRVLLSMPMRHGSQSTAPAVSSEARFLLAAVTSSFLDEPTLRSRLRGVSCMSTFYPVIVWLAKICVLLGMELVCARQVGLIVDMNVQLQRKNNRTWELSHTTALMICSATWTLHLRRVYDKARMHPRALASFTSCHQKKNAEKRRAEKRLSAGHHLQKCRARHVCTAAQCAASARAEDRRRAPPSSFKPCFTRRTPSPDRETAFGRTISQSDGKRGIRIIQNKHGPCAKELRKHP